MTERSLVVLRASVDNLGGMVTRRTDKEKNWLLLQLWGLDTPVTALCWAVACAALMQITMITAGPMLLVAAGVWCGLMLSRLVAAIKSPDAWQAAFYRRNLSIIVVLLFGVGMATLWMLFFLVGRSVLDYAIVPALFLLLARLCHHATLHQTRLLLQSLAFAMLCALPAFYFSFSLSPLHMVTTAPVWYMGLLFYLWGRERQAIREGKTDAGFAFFNVGALIVLLVSALISSVTAPMFERTLCITVAIGTGCLQGFSRFIPRLPAAVALSLSWLTMALPALLGIILYAPSAW